MKFKTMPCNYKEIRTTPTHEKVRSRWTRLTQKIVNTHHHSSKWGPRKPFSKSIDYLTFNRPSINKAPHKNCNADSKFNRKLCQNKTLKISFIISIKSTDQYYQKGVKATEIHSKNSPNIIFLRLTQIRLAAIRERNVE